MNFSKEKVSLNLIDLDEKNPRLSITIRKEGEKLINQLIRTIDSKKVIILIGDILKENSFNPSMNFSLIKNKERFIVLDGNRRILSNILMKQKYEEIKNEDISSFIKKNEEKIKKFLSENKFVDSVIYKNRDEAMKWIDKNHIISEDGASTLPWHTFARRIANKDKMAINLNEILRKNKFEPINLKTKYSVIERIFKSKEIKKYFGFNNNTKKLVNENSVFNFIKKIDIYKFNINDAYNKQKRQKILDIYVKNEDNEEALKSNYENHKNEINIFNRTYDLLKNKKIKNIIKQIKSINFIKNIDLINLSIRSIFEILINLYLLENKGKTKTWFHNNKELKNKFQKIYNSIKISNVNKDNQKIFSSWKSNINTFLSEFNSNIHDENFSSFSKETEKWIEYLDILFYEIYKNQT